MEILIDGETGCESSEKSASLADTIVDVCDRLNAAGRSVLRISIDGQPLGLNSFQEDLKGMDLAEIGKLEFQSRLIVDLVAETIEPLQEFVPELPTTCRQLAEEFQRGDGDARFEQLSKLFDIWHAIKTREEQVCRALEIDSDGLSINGVSLPQLHEELNAELEKAARAVETRDTVALGDLLEYELAPKAELETDIVDLLRVRLEERRG